MADKKKRSIEDFVSNFMKPVEKDNYVVMEDNLAPKAVAEDPKKAQAYKQMLKEDAVKNQTASDGMINVTGAVTEKPSVKETIKQALAPQAPAPQAPQNESLYNKPYERPAANAANAQMPVIPQVEGPSAWERAMIGATPLLVGLLTGNQLEGTQTSSKYFVGEESDRFKRDKDLNGKLAELAMKRAMASEAETGKRRYTAQTIALNDGTNVKATFDTFSGKYLLPDGSEIPSNMIRSGYAVNPEEFDRRTYKRSEVKRDDADYLGQNTRVDPTTGQLGVVRNGVITPVEGQETGKLNVRQQDERNKLAKDFQQNPIVKRVMPVLSTSQSLQALLNSGKPVSQKAAQTLLARMSGEVGNLNMMEQQLYMGSPSLNESAKRWLNLQATDKPLQPHEVEELISIANHYTRSSKEMLEGAIKETRDVGMQDLNLPEDTVRRITSPIADPLLDQANKAEQKSKITHVNYKGQTYEPPNREENLAVEIDGNLYWTSDSWEDVKKEHPKAKRLN